MHGIGLVEQNLCLTYIMLNKTYSWHTLCWTKPIPAIGYVICSTKPIPGILYVGQNHIRDLFVKICITRCCPKLNNRVFKLFFVFLLLFSISLYCL